MVSKTRHCERWGGNSVALKHKGHWIASLRSQRRQLFLKQTSLLRNDDKLLYKHAYYAHTFTAFNGNVISFWRLNKLIMRATRSSPDSAVTIASISLKQPLTDLYLSLSISFANSMI